MENLILSIFLGLIAIIVILFVVDLFKKRKKSKPKNTSEEIISEEEINDTVNNEFSDSHLNTSEIIKKFHIFIGYPYQATGLNRSARRQIKRHHIKFLWNWNRLPEEKQSVKKICEYLIQSGNNKSVFNKYCFSK